MNIPKRDPKILTKRNFSVGVDHETAEYALTAQFESAVPPLVIQCDKVIVLLRFMNILWNIPNKLIRLGSQQVARSVEKSIVP